MYGEVLRTEELGPHMVRVVLGGEGLRGFTACPWTDGYVNAQFLPPGAGYGVPFDEEAVRGLPRDERPFPRRYTVRDWDGSAGLLTIDFVVHGDEGLAGRWARSAQPGDRLQLRGPAGAYAPEPAADWHLMVGDESALPAIAASAERVPAGRPVLVVLLVDGPADELPLHSRGELRVRWVHRTPGDDSPLLRAVEALAFPAGRVQAFVHGEAAETRALRRHLLGERGLAREDLSLSPYWRRGHTDEQWRTTKAAWLREVEQDVLVPTA